MNTMACRFVSIVSIGYSSFSRSRIFASQLTSCRNIYFSKNCRMKCSDNSLDTKIKSSDSPENLVDIIQSNKLSGNQASLSLTRAAQLHLQNTLQISNFTSDPIFQELCTQIANEKYNISTESLVLTLINVCRIKTEPVMPLIVILEPECRRRLRVMQIRHLIFLITHHDALLAINSDKLNDLVKETAAVLEVRLKDVFEVKNLTQLLMHSRAISKTLPEKLQHHIISLMDYFSFSDLTQFCKAMLVGKFKRGILLRTISNKMISIKEEWSTERVLELLKCFAGMSFHDRNLIIAFSNYLQSQIKNCSPEDVLNIAQVYSSLRISNNELLGEIEKFTIKQIGTVSFRDLRCILQVFFVLNYIPSNEFFEAVTTQMLQGWSDLKPYLQLELSWCMLGFDKLPTVLLEKVLQLNPDDFSPALSVKHQHVVSYAKTKSLTAQMTSNDPERSVRLDVALRPLQVSVKRILDEVIDEKFLEANILTPVGHAIDFQVLLDDQQRPIDKSSEEAFARLAILVHGPTSYLSTTEKFVGPVALKRKQLKSAGYRLVEIGYREWNTLKSEVDKKMFLEKKLNNK